jgi:hypothetical protein
MHERDEKFIQDFGQKSERKRPLTRPKHRWEYNIKMNLKHIRSGGIDWTYLVQNRDQWWAPVNMVMNF